MTRIAATLTIIIALFGMEPANEDALAQQPAKSNIRAMIDVQANLKSRSGALMVIEVRSKNSGAVPVYLATNPKRVDGSNGVYVDTDAVDSSTLICTLQFYPPNPFKPFTDETGVHLTRLDAGESHEELIKLSLPLRSTEPPFSAVPGTRAISLNSIKRIEVRIGALPVSPSLTELVQRKVAPHNSFSGMERIKVGTALKSLHDVQEVALSNTVEIEP